jgi:Subtilase family
MNWFSLICKSKRICFLSLCTCVPFLGVAQTNEAIEKRILKNRTTLPVENEYLLLKADKVDIDKLARADQIKIYNQLSDGYFIGRVLNADEKLESVQIIGTANNKWKAPFLISDNWKEQSNEFTIVCQDKGQVISLMEKKKIKFEVLARHSQSNTIKIRLGDNKRLEEIMNLPQVLFIDTTKDLPREEADISNSDLSVNKVNIVQQKYPELNGEGFIVSVKERSFDETDIDLMGRTVSSPLKDSEITLHANQMATIIAGGGNIAPTSKGVAWAGQVSSSSFTNLLPDDAQSLPGINIQNHSYGTAIDNQYGAEARAYDVATNTNPIMLHIFSAGNSGAFTSLSGPYKGIAGYANITGNFKMAKNVLSVSANYKDGSVDERNSRGPAYDGRVRPELVAYGQDGTSDAAALVSGISVLVQQAYKQNYSSLPSSSLVKAALIAGADDAGMHGIDFATGYGSVNANRTISLIKSNYFVEQTIAANETKVIDVSIPIEIKSLKIVLTWNDPAANAGDSKALVNDLDFTLTTPDLSATSFPWVLSSYPHIDSLQLLAKRKADHLNTIEMITVDNPVNGIYKIKVKANSLATTSQKFSIAYWFEKAESFQWTYPTQSTAIETPKEIYFRWDSNLTGTADLEISYNDGIWKQLATDIDIGKGFYAWNNEEKTFSRAVLRMKTGIVYHQSDTFALSPVTDLRVGFNCADKFMLNWEKVPSAEKYRIYTLGEKYLEPILETANTSLILSKANYRQKYYAVKPLNKSLQGAQSISFDYKAQNVNCYYSNFTGVLSNDKSTLLTLSLSTLYNISEIQFRKIIGQNSSLIKTITSFPQLDYDIEDKNPVGGTNRYVASIILKDGTRIDTEEISILFGDENTYMIFPNPVKLSEEISFLTDGNEISVAFYDLTGRQVVEGTVFGSLFRIPANKFEPGLYVYQFRRNEKPVSSGRLYVKN